MPLAVLVVLFLVVPACEIYVLIQVGQQIGALPTVLLLIADSLIGAWLLKREGRKAWAALQSAIAARRVPAREVADGALVVLGGAFLLTPGFLTDIVGVLCLLPPSRAVLRKFLTTIVARRLLPGSGARSRGTGRRVVDGEVVEPPARPELDED